MLADAVRSEPLGAQTKVLDLCTGSGLLAVVAATGGAGKVVAVDVSRRAVFSTRLNASLNGVTVHARRGDLFSAVDGERFDLVVSNPPYLPSPREELPRSGLSRAWEGGARGRAIIDRICATAPEHLRPAGTLLLAHSSVCGEEATLSAMRSSGLEAAVLVRRRGSLGPRLRGRAEWLREQGMLLEGDSEELLIFRAQQQPSALSSDR